MKKRSATITKVVAVKGEPWLEIGVLFFTTQRLDFAPAAGL